MLIDSCSSGIKKVVYKKMVSIKKDTIIIPKLIAFLSNVEELNATKKRNGL